VSITSRSAVRSAAIVGVVAAVAVAVAVGIVAEAHQHRPLRSRSSLAAASGATPFTATRAPLRDGPGTAAATDRGAVRELQLTFTDPSRTTVARPPLPARQGRILRTSVWYPAGAGPLPLVVFGHGFAVQPTTYLQLLRTIAAAGFVVAAPNFPGSTSAAPGAPNEADLRDEPCDLLFAAAHLELEARQGGPLAGLVAAGPVALAGQSDGATAAAFAALSDPAGTCGGSTVAAVVAFSANPVPVRPGARAAVLAITGSADTVNPPARTRALFAEAPSTAYLLTSLGDSHLGPSTTSPRHGAIAAVVVDFLRATLLDSTSARRRLATDARQPGLQLASR
jgi:dienelactone hydrolase